MVDTGISVAPGDTVRFDCQGWINQGWSARIAGHIIVDGAGRNPDGSLNNSKPSDSGYPLVGSVRYALIGRIVDPSGTPSSPFYIGKVTGPMAVGAPGRLWIGANDNNPGDNGPASGYRTPWRVSIDHTVPDPLPPPGTPGLRISDIQILQVAMPSFPNDTVLVAGKSTTVRAFLDVRHPLAPGTLVNGFVEVNGGARIYALNPSPMGGTDAVQPQVGGAAPDPQQTSASLNFEVAGKFLPVDGNFSHHTFKVTAFIGAENPQAGFSHTDQKTAGFSNGLPMGINLISIIGRDGGDPAAFMGNLSIEKMEEQLPVPDGGLVATRCIPPVFTVPDIGADDVHNLVNRINATRIAEFIDPGFLTGRDKIVFGVVVPGARVAAKFLTTLIVPLRPNVETTEGTNGVNTDGVHELGHMYGVGHAAGCESPRGIDPNLPKALLRPGWTTSLHQVVRSGTPANMGYCQMKWRTSIEYLHIHRRLLRDAGMSA
ncbi:MAG TPA: hypothetical protein VF006_06705 [Longimicrobium sp.]